MKKFVCILLFLPFWAVAQEIEKKPAIEFHGFIQSDYWWNTRDIVMSREGLYVLYPKNEELDKNGVDINERSSFNFAMIMSRLSGKITGPDVMGMKTSGVLEADFSGITNADINGFRLRHAFVKLDGNSFGFLFGHYWHPMFTADCFPVVISMNTGSPFNPFIRSPQMRTYYKTGNLSLELSLLSQRDFASSGPNGTSPEYLTNTGIPESQLHLKYANKNHLIGIGGGIKTLQPRKITDSAIVTNERISSFSSAVYYKYKSDKWLVQAKGIFGTNLTDFIMLGGYAVKSISPDNDERTYTPIQTFGTWGQFLYGNNLKAGIFAGFTKNMGTLSEIGSPESNPVYMRGIGIDYVYRVSPRISYQVGKTRFATEFELTSAAYGTPDNKLISNDSEPFNNYRILFDVTHFF